jgi:hypothetical protein
METPIIQDDGPEATWFVNTGNYTFMDYTTNVRFEPRTPVRTKLTDWMAGQPTIVAYEFPKPPEEVVEELVVAKAKK